MEELQTKKRSWTWLLVAIILVAIIIIGYLVYMYAYKDSPEEIMVNSSPEATESTESWQAGTEIVLAGTTSTDTHKLADGTYRMYYMSDGQIVYATSTDGLSFTGKKSTGVVESSDLMLSNPAVLKIADNSWIMVYEQSPKKTPGSTSPSTPGVSSQRNLYLASSTDGMSFVSTGLIIDSSLADNYFASVPDLVMTEDGTVHMYYVSRGDSIASATSKDNGKTWQRESGYRLTNSAVDPDVLVQEEGGKTSWVMYYTILDPTRNALYKSTSLDGITWTTGTKLFGKNGTNSAIVDADVYQINDTKYGMFFGQAAGGDSTGGGDEMNLFFATLDKSVF